MVAMKRLLAALLSVALLVGPPGALAEPLDFDVPGGHFFTQTGSGDGLAGYAVIDDEEASFWSEFRRLGGVEGVGYPISQRFEWDGFIVQAMQRGVLQWRPEVGRAYFVNVFDQMSSAGKDDWLLTVRSTPRPLGPEFDAGKKWDQIVADRLALLETNPALRSAYYAVPDPLNLYGLPTSRVVDNGNHYVIRLQRAVIQQWKVDVPWAKAGQVTVANGGAVGAEAGLYPADALAPSTAERPQPPSRGAPRPSTPQEAALELVNHYRALAGAPPLALHEALQQAASAHAQYYVLNRGDPALAGVGLHKETPGAPSYTGATMGERARNAGYGNWAVDENMGLVGDPRRMIEWAMDTVNHRWNMLHPSAVHLGYGIATAPAVDVMNLGFSGSRPQAALPTVYPGDGQQGVPTSANVYETPDPAPGVPRPLGYPLTISFHVRDSVQFGDYSLVDADGQAVRLYTAEKTWLRSLALIPAAPLRAGTTYRASVSGTVNGQPFTKVWSFTTR